MDNQIFRKESLDQIWASVASIDSFASGTAQVQDGTMRIIFEDPQIAKSVQTGMTVTAGDASAQVSSIGYSDDGQMFALAPTSLADGTYSVKVVYRKTQVLSLLFN